MILAFAVPGNKARKNRRQPEGAAKV